MAKSKKKSIKNKFNLPLFIGIFLVAVVAISQAYFYQKNISALAAADNTKITWRIISKSTVAASKVSSLGGPEKMKAEISTRINPKLAGKNVKLNVVSTTQASNHIFTATLEGTTTVKEMAGIISSDIGPEFNLTASASDIHIKGRAARDQKIPVTIVSNPSTGYGWNITNDSNNGISETDKTKYITTAKNVKDIVGVPSYQTVYLKTTKDGQNDIHLSYKRPWETEASQKTVEITVDSLPTSIDLSNTPTVGFFQSKFKNLSLVLNRINGLVRNKATTVSAATNLPAAFDWRTSATLPAVRNQAACGSCWAFASQAVFESTMAIQGKVAPVDSSEQFLVSCNTEGYNCNGGWWAVSYDVNKLGASQTTVGAVNESDFPYTATNGTCQANLNHPYKGTTWNYVNSLVTIPSNDSIKQYIYEHGPVGVAVCAGPAFQAYRTGVFTTDEKSYCGGGVNHAVVLVGWDDSKNAWVMRNSWGTSWGEAGYMYIGYGISNIGYRAVYMDYTTPVVPTITLAPTTAPAPTIAPTATPTPIPTVAPTATPVPSTDTIAPTVSITNPANGASVSKTVTIAATAQDNVGGSGMSRVEFYVNNALKCSDTAAPYTCNWKVTGRGTATIEARAYDKVSNKSSAKITVNIR